ncbi:DUF4282 domain-containing protein [Blastopirellula marina]|uniref:GYF domain-containing protein n=1 Tax=Blastopirellula marina TaxID=124 RepID=A0A2S8FWZ5_9BACT|nr:DUF4282 domain-containing protein [Blastopirellula marina]PQO36697.1 hypothetical protein C5Y98_11945 [Blastopirellula marina]PTL44527.1 DUF4282 domain-containing protein [Blastopirellula marina]
MADEFFYKLSPNEGEQGPIDSKTLKKLAKSGGISPNSLLKRGTSDWVVASTVKGLFPDPAVSTVAEATPVEPQTAAPATPPPVKTGGRTFPDLSSTKAAPDVPSGLDSLMVGGKKPSSRPVKESPVEAKSPAPMATPAKTKAAPEEAPPAASIPGTEPNPFASDSQARPHQPRRAHGGLGSLFNFDVMIAPTVIKMLFLLAVVLIMLGWLGSTVFMFLEIVVRGGGIGEYLVASFLALLGLVIVFLYVILFRICAEVSLVFFQIHDNVRDIRELMEDKSGIID